MVNGTERLTVTILEAAKLLGISRNLAYTLANSDKLPGVLRLGKRLVISKARLIDYINANQNGKEAPNG
jgi:excisionase family DNA binding protein